VAKLNEAVAESQTPLTFGTIVVFTDGTDRAARVTQGEMMDALDETDYDTFAVGVGNEIDEETLSRIGYSGYVLVQDAAAVTNAFQTLGERIKGMTQRFYLLSYCSPARAGVHRVTVEAVDPTTQVTGDTSYEFDATGFGPNCNPATPPPFDTSGQGRPVRRQRPRTGARIQVQASASAGGDPESGDY
jgi:hypothetical protein